MSYQELVAHLVDPEYRQELSSLPLHVQEYRYQQLAQQYIEQYSRIPKDDKDLLALVTAANAPPSDLPSNGSIQHKKRSYIQHSKGTEQKGRQIKQ